MDTLIFIDSYISNFERVTATSNLISQIREHFPNHKIALLNKYPDSWRLDSLVDYYFYYGDSFMVGRPPQWMLDQELYERAYVFVGINSGICENWVPLTGVTDHVAGIYNSFILTSRIAKSLGFKKVFKIEYDTILDKDESQDMLKDISEFKDYLIYGKRQEGQWAKDHQYLIDVHLMGYSVNLFNNFELIDTDDEFWELCQKVGYYGKWIEYIIPSIIEYQKKTSFLEGISHSTKIREYYPNTQFDIINSPGYWTKKWDNMPKICRVSYDKGETESKDEICLFFWNEKEEGILNTNCKITNNKGDIIFDHSYSLKPRYWALHKLEINEELYVTNTNTYNNETEVFKHTLTLDNIKDLPTRFLYEN